jgi:DNA-binding response OmpR family regulator
MKKILIFEDDEDILGEMLAALEDKVNVLYATTVGGGVKLFLLNTDADCIIMDACLPGREFNVEPLMKSVVNSGYDKPIIAASSSPVFRDLLKKLGATHKSTKREAVFLALDLLEITWD